MKNSRHAIALLTMIAATAGSVGELAANDSNAVLLDQIAAADTNRDGSISKQELIAFRAANFVRLDRNADGVLMRSDIPAMAARLRPEVDFDRLIKQFDANKDGKVSRPEFVGGPTTLFDAADTNKDGLLTKAERSAAIKAAKG